MQTAKDYLHVFLDMGDALLNSGAEIFRVEDTLNRMGYACGAIQMNVFVITSSIVITMEFPGDGARTQTRRVREDGGNDFTKLEQLNDLSRRFCRQPVSAAELRKEFDKINADKPKPLWKLFGSLLAASSFALFYGGSISDAIAAGLGAVLIWALQQYFRPVCMNEVTFQFAASFLTGCVICGLVLLCPFLHMDKIMIGDIMLLIPGLMSTNAIRDVLIGDTLSGIIRLIAALLLAAALALGFMGAILLFRRLGFRGIWNSLPYEKEIPAFGSSWWIYKLDGVSSRKRTLGKCLSSVIAGRLYCRCVCGNSCKNL